jgi:polyketide synthase PksN
MKQKITLNQKRKEIEKKLFHNHTDIEMYTDNSQTNNQVKKSTQELSKFPELVLLNEETKRKPIFWIHSVGGVQPYFMIARKTERPFYGIEARGWRTNRIPLRGIEAMAAYYVHIIKTTQPTGPYDLGGYSLGGLVAHEITRQLQELGDVVSSIVMLDTLATDILKNTKDVSNHTRLLQAANFTLATQVLQDPDRLKKVLIHCDEVDWTQDDSSIITSLSKLAQKKGALETKMQLESAILKMSRIHEAYEYDRYTVVPLSKPEEIACYYFRNKSGLFFGDFAPYYSIPKDGVNVDHLNYWEQWKTTYSNIHVMDVNSSNHLMFLSEKKVYGPILAFCKQLYSDEGISPHFLKTFQQKQKT